MIFPKNASAKERETNWQLIAEIKDADFGFNTPKKKTNNTKLRTKAYRMA